MKNNNKLHKYNINKVILFNKIMKMYIIKILKILILIYHLFKMNKYKIILKIIEKWKLNKCNKFKIYKIKENYKKSINHMK